LVEDIDLTARAGESHDELLIVIADVDAQIATGGDIGELDGGRRRPAYCRLVGCVAAPSTPACTPVMLMSWPALTRSATTPEPAELMSSIWEQFPVAARRMFTGNP
jgi:hypothetical protein